MAEEHLRALHGARVLLGVTGGIAAYKSAELARLLVKAGAEVQVVMTEAAKAFVGPATFAALTHRPVPAGTFDRPEDVLHVRLARESDLMVIAPATADVIARYAHGLAPDLLSNVLLTAICPVLLAPAMHTEMWQHPATQANLQILTARGVRTVGPEEGDLAGGDTGVGRMSEPDTILEAAARVISRDADLAGVVLVVTAGGTQEPIDPVRFLTNRSSGKMGYSIATEARRRGARVTLISAPTKLAQPEDVTYVPVRTTRDMHAAVMQKAEGADAVVLAAAVSDFRPAAYSRSKIKKDGGSPKIELALNPDIAADLGARKGRRIVIGFAAETDEHIPNARKKLEAKNMDMIVVNDVARADIGFDVEYNEVIFLGADGSEAHLPLQLKTQVAHAICDRVAEMISARDAT